MGLTWMMAKNGNCNVILTLQEACGGKNVAFGIVENSVFEGL